MYFLYNFCLLNEITWNWLLEVTGIFSFVIFKSPVCLLISLCLSVCAPLVTFKTLGWFFIHSGLQWNQNWSVESRNNVVFWCLTSLI
jgi:hypothetical protein